MQRGALTLLVLAVTHPAQQCMDTLRRVVVVAVEQPMEVLAPYPTYGQGVAALVTVVLAATE
jgi:hypothetical protein